jgi:hypothetical protein
MLHPDEAAYWLPGLLEALVYFVDQEVDALVAVGLRSAQHVIGRPLGPIALLANLDTMRGARSLA